MVLVDEDKVPARRIIDLEWLKKKPAGWQGVLELTWKQWLVVTELVPEKHQDMLDEAGKVKKNLKRVFNALQLAF